MKVLKVSEIYSGIDQLIQKKNNERKQFLAIKNAITNILNLDDALKGKGGEAIRNHFSVLHMPVLDLFDSFIDNYVQELKDIKQMVGNYESQDGFVRQDFIEQDVKNGISKVEKLTHDIVKSINEHLNSVSDIVAVSPVNTAQFDAEINNANTQIEKTITDLNHLDQNSTSKLEPSSNGLQQIQQLTAKISDTTKTGIFQSQNTLHDYVILLRNTIVSFGAAYMNSGKHLKIGDLSFKMFKKDGKVFIKVRGKEISNLRDFEKYRKMLVENMGGRWKWSRDFVTNLVNDGVPLYKNFDEKFFKSNSNKFLNSQFDDLGGYITRLNQSSLKVAGNTFKNEMKVWSSFTGWKEASTFTKFGKGAGILGLGLTVWDNATGNFRNANTGEWEYTGGKQIKKFAVDTTVDIGAGAAAMAAGAAAGSLFLPPAGTIVGAVVGATAFAAVNWKFGDPPQSIVDHTKNLANKAVDKAVDVASKAVDKIGDCIGGIGKKLDKVFW